MEKSQRVPLYSLEKCGRHQLVQRYAASLREQSVGEVLALLGGRLFEPEFCDDHAGDLEVCTNSTDCSLRSLWRAVQFVVDQVLRKTTLKNLLCNEQEMTFWVSGLVNLSREPNLKQLSKSL